MNARDGVIFQRLIIGLAWHYDYDYCRAIVRVLIW